MINTDFEIKYSRYWDTVERHTAGLLEILGHCGSTDCWTSSDIFVCFDWFIFSVIDTFWIRAVSFLEMFIIIVKASIFDHTGEHLTSDTYDEEQESTTQPLIPVDSKDRTIWITVTVVMSILFITLLISITAISIKIYRAKSSDKPKDHPSGNQRRLHDL